ncbi:MAG: hydantoinase/oxoprolinase family protein [Coriobacteriia bacterium]|nr:hydantoinase/oxoprolinase family protein [Coriobacteriia bacterium]MCL2750785.1 hydantoinase/oxoprolinase family protein [Coriobacteriia bacterium]
MKIGIGIDTGGTYTDAVIYDFESKEILGSSKALTTRENLTVGILAALDALDHDLVKDASNVSLSTTLATNACVEDRGGNAKLIFLGIDARVIDEYGGAYGLPPSSEMYLQESFTKFSGEMEREPNWDLFRQSIKSGFEGLDGVGIIENNGVRNGGIIEKKARNIFQEEHRIPVVCAHELFGELNCLQRGASTLLNARLFPIIHEFLQAIKLAMTLRGINATISIVRSDGSLMTDSLAYSRPVETLLCGPAASVIGSAYLATTQNSLIIDMGGTTSDIALIQNKVPVKVTNGIDIGRWKTFVDGLYIKTIGLGGDTAVHYDAKGVYLEEYRIVPLSVAADKHPCIIENLKRLPISKKKFKSFAYEHYTLIKDIKESVRHSARAKELCASLIEEPVSQRELTIRAHKLGVSTAELSQLIKEGIIQVIGLTPTDIMHIKGDFSGFSTQAASLAAEYVAQELNESVDELCYHVYDRVKQRMYASIVNALLENKSGSAFSIDLQESISSMISESYKEVSSPEPDVPITLTYQTDYSLMGVGAPTHIFLSDVASLLNTKAMLPKHHEVANALGAIVSNVQASCVVEIRPSAKPDGSVYYTVFGPGENKSFGGLPKAEEYALAQAELGAQNEVYKRGAAGKVLISSKVERSEFKEDGLEVFLGSKVRAQGVGSIGL